MINQTTQISKAKRTMSLQLTWCSYHLFVSWAASMKNKVRKKNHFPIKTYLIQVKKVVVYQKPRMMMKWARVTISIQTPTNPPGTIKLLSLLATKVKSITTVEIATTQTCLSPQVVKNSQNTQMIMCHLINPQLVNKNKPMTITRSNKCFCRCNWEGKSKKISWEGLLWTKKSRNQWSTSLAWITGRENSSSSNNRAAVLMQMDRIIQDSKT